MSQQRIEMLQREIERRDATIAELRAILSAQSEAVQRDWLSPAEAAGLRQELARLRAENAAELRKSDQRLASAARIQRGKNEQIEGLIKQIYDMAQMYDGQLMALRAEIARLQNENISLHAARRLGETENIRLQNEVARLRRCVDTFIFVDAPSGSCSAQAGCECEADDEVDTICI